MKKKVENTPAKALSWATDEDFEKIKALAASLVEDGELSDDDVKRISAAVEEQERRGRLSDSQNEELRDVVSEGIRRYGTNKVTVPMKVFAILSLLGGIATVVVLVWGSFSIFTNGSALIESYQGSTVELILEIAQTILLAAGAILHVVLGFNLLRKKRYGAALVASTLVVFGVADMFLEVLLTGISLNLLFLAFLVAFRVALSVYLSPSLAQERKLADAMLMSDTKLRAETKTLGLDLDGKGYIKLDFFNIFWVFVVTCVLGVIVEVIWHMVVVEPGVYQDRRGLLFGPFSPIYGVGAVLMTIALNRFKDANLVVTFIVCTLIGGVFEYFVSLWMEVAFGVIAWDYTGQFLSIDGRTCLLFASMFGLLGLWWIKWALPRLLKVINMIPWKVRYSVTTICAVLMLFNIGMTLQALDCWQERVNGKPVVTEVQQFYAEYFPNDVMQNRFQSMTITPQNK